VALSVSGVPAGASVSLQPTSISGVQTSALTINAGNAALGTHWIVVTGSSGSLTHSTKLRLTIT